MNRLLFFCILLLIMAMSPVQKAKVVFFGDSITQAGVNKGGYIDLIQQAIVQQSRAGNYELIGAGIGGNKVYDLYLRMEEDVLAHNPEIVVIYVGINDVWHKTSGTGTDQDKFEKFYVAIIKKLQAKNIKVFICTPTVIGELKDNANPQDKDLNAYSDVIRRIAGMYNCKLIDLRKAFTDYEEANNKDNSESGLLTTDRVHLTAAGNRLVADEMLKALALK